MKPGKILRCMFLLPILGVDPAQNLAQYNKKSKWHTRTPTHGLANTLRMRTAVSHGQWQPRKAVSALLGRISMAELAL